MGAYLVEYGTRAVALALHHVAFQCLGHVGRRGLLVENAIRKPFINAALCVHVGFCFQHGGNFVSTLSSLCRIGRDEALADLAQHVGLVLKFAGISRGVGPWVMNHHVSHGGHEHLVACHSNHARRAGSNACNLHGDFALMFAQCGVHFRTCEHIAARRVDVDRYVPALCKTLTESPGYDLPARPKPVYVGHDLAVDMQFVRSALFIAGEVIKALSLLVHGPLLWVVFKPSFDDLPPFSFVRSGIVGFKAFHANVLSCSHFDIDWGIRRKALLQFFA